MFFLSIKGEAWTESARVEDGWRIENSEILNDFSVKEIRWFQNVTNEQVLKLVGERESLLRDINLICLASDKERSAGLDICKA